MHEIVIIFSAIYLSKATYVISSSNLRTELQKLPPDAMIIPWIYRSTKGKTIYVAFTNVTTAFIALSPLIYKTY